MRTTTKSVLVALAFGLIAYAMIDGIRYQSAWGISMALCSCAALVMCIRLSQKMERLENESTEENQA